MIKPHRVVLGMVVGTCAGMTAGVMLIGIGGGLAGIPWILRHSGPNINPVTMFLAAFVMYALYVGLPVGAPIGAIIGLIAGAIWGLVPGASGTRKVTAPADDVAAEVIAKAFEFKQPASSTRQTENCLYLSPLSGCCATTER